MADCTGCCGTGSGNFPQPGDPSTTTILRAVVILGGILLTWDYPGLNPHAVAHFHLYRSTSADPLTAVFLATAAGNSHFDYLGETPTGITYYYWVQVVSVNGTVGELVGPAAATYISEAEWIHGDLIGRVNDTLLSNEVKTELGKIVTLSDDLVAEITNRQFADQSISDALNASISKLDAVDTLLQTEIAERVDGDSALVTQVDLILAKSNDNAAAIITEQVARADADSALASQITTVQAQADNTAAALVTEQTTRADADSALSTQVSTLQTKVTDPSTGLEARAGALESFRSHVENQTGTGFLATSTYIQGLVADIDGNSATIANEQIARADGDSALSSSLNSLSSTVDGHTTTISTHASSIDGLRGKWGVTIDAGGRITGIQLNNGTGGSSFTVHADYFGVTLPGYTGGVPFSVQNVNGSPRVTIHSAWIGDANITNAKIADLAVTNAKIGSAAVTSAKIQDAAITNAKIGSAAVDTLQIAGNAVTVPNGATGGYGSVGASFSQVPYVTLTEYWALAPGAVIVIGTCMFSNNGPIQSAHIRLTQNGAGAGQVGMTMIDGTSGTLTTVAIFYPGTGSHTYALEAKCDSSGMTTGAASIVVLGAKR